MSTFGVKCFVLLALYHTSVISGEKCFLPHGQPNLDFKKISETSWFVGLQTHDALATKVQCVKLDNFTTTITGFKFIAEEYGDGPVDVKYSVNFVRRGANGLYSFDKQKDEISLISSHRLIFQNDYTKEVHDTGIADCIFGSQNDTFINAALPSDHRRSFKYFPLPEYLRYPYL
uniref:uncharacterized protein LOC120332426 isoform X2 n=1 Tax=Styela clava TaxID=7725 RepID=UPI001939870C|nr:uncharacterized protein LOC120332426 isoform X2 [Styela clava]